MSNSCHVFFFTVAMMLARSLSLESATICLGLHILHMLHMISYAFSSERVTWRKYPHRRISPNPLVFWCFYRIYRKRRVTCTGSTSTNERTLLTLPVQIPDEEKKINLNFYFHSLWCLKRFP